MEKGSFFQKILEGLERVPYWVCFLVGFITAWLLLGR